jgi:galactokinase
MGLLAQAPGRVNLLGDHTDTTGGLVLPMAIDRVTQIHGTRLNGWVRLRSQQLEGVIEFPLDAPIAPQEGPAWGRYVAAVAAELSTVTELHGFDGEITSTVPVGGGLSSSAALEVAVALALTPHMVWDATVLAELCRQAEHQASGVPCGVMDQLIALVGRAGCAVMIDCSTLEHSPVRLPPGIEVAVRFVAHRQLATSAYAQRTAEVQAVEMTLGPLRALGLSDLDRLSALGDSVLRRRARHVITENHRVRAGARALSSGDATAFGQAMVASHASLRDDFEVSTATMDEAVERWLDRPGVYGARLTGGGFGGCIVAVAEAGTFANDPEVWLVTAVDGATGPRL